jgi:hypothetical protein
MPFKYFCFLKWEIYKTDVMKKLIVISVFVIICSNLLAIPDTRSKSGVMVAIDEYLYENADDYKSIEYIKVGLLIEFEAGFFSQKVKFRTKNKYGNYVLNEWYFTVIYNGVDAKVASIDNVSSVKKLVNSGELKIKNWYKSDGTRVYNRDMQVL